jgi:hypothetical protein
LYRKRRTVVESLATRVELSLHTDIFLRIVPTTNELEDAGVNQDTPEELGGGKNGIMEEK